MRSYYFYTLNEERLPKYEIDFYKKVNKLEEEALAKNNLGSVLLIHQYKNFFHEESEKFELQNGQDARFLVRYGCKEVSKDIYEAIKEDDHRIVKSFDERSIFLLKQFNHRTDGWHFPFKVEAKNRLELRRKLKSMFPKFEEFCFLK